MTGSEDTPSSVRRDALQAGLDVAMNQNPMAVGMLKTPVGRVAENGRDTNKLAEMLYRAGNKAGFDTKIESSAISPSTYITFRSPADESGEMTRQVRISNHADKYPELADGVRFSSDPETGLSFENAVNWLAKEGYPTSLSKRYKDVPNWDQVYSERIAQERIAAEERSRLLAEKAASYVPTFGDYLIESRPVKSGGKRYDVTSRSGLVGSVYSKDVPAEIKTSTNRDDLYRHIISVLGEK